MFIQVFDESGIYDVQLTCYIEMPTSDPSNFLYIWSYLDSRMMDKIL